MHIYLVGGAVRDSLLNLPVSERDWVVVGVSPEQMLQQGFRQVGKDFPVFNSMISLIITASSLSIHRVYSAV